MGGGVVLTNCDWTVWGQVEGGQCERGGSSHDCMTNCDWTVLSGERGQCGGEG